MGYFDELGNLQDDNTNYSLFDNNEFEKESNDYKIDINRYMEKSQNLDRAAELKEKAIYRKGELLKESDGSLIHDSDAMIRLKEATNAGIRGLDWLLEATENVVDFGQGDLIGYRDQLMAEHEGKRYSMSNKDFIGARDLGNNATEKLKDIYHNAEHNPNVEKGIYTLRKFDGYNEDGSPKYIYKYGLAKESADTRYRDQYVEDGFEIVEEKRFAGAEEWEKMWNASQGVLDSRVLDSDKVTVDGKQLSRDEASGINFGAGKTELLESDLLGTDIDKTQEDYDRNAQYSERLSTLADARWQAGLDDSPIDALQSGAASLLVDTADFVLDVITPFGDNTLLNEAKKKENIDKWVGYDRTSSNRALVEAATNWREGNYVDALTGVLTDPNTMAESLPMMLAMFVPAGSISKVNTIVKGIGTATKAKDASKVLSLTKDLKKYLSPEQFAEYKKYGDISKKVKAMSHFSKNAGFHVVAGTLTNNVLDERIENKLANGEEGSVDMIEAFGAYATTLPLLAIDRLSFGKITGMDKLSQMGLKAAFKESNKKAREGIFKKLGKKALEIGAAAGAEGAQEYLQTWGEIFGANVGVNGQNIADVMGDDKKQFEALMGGLAGVGAGAQLSTAVSIPSAVGQVFKPKTTKAIENISKVEDLENKHINYQTGEALLAESLLVPGESRFGDTNFNESIDDFDKALDILVSKSFDKESNPEAFEGYKKAAATRIIGSLFERLKNTPPENRKEGEILVTQFLDKLTNDERQLFDINRFESDKTESLVDRYIDILQDDVEPSQEVKEAFKKIEEEVEAGSKTREDADKEIEDINKVLKSAQVEVLLNSIAQEEAVVKSFKKKYGSTILNEEALNSNENDTLQYDTDISLKQLKKMVDTYKRKGFKKSFEEVQQEVSFIGNVIKGKKEGAVRVDPSIKKYKTSIRNIMSSPARIKSFFLNKNSGLGTSLGNLSRFVESRLEKITFNPSRKNKVNSFNSRILNAMVHENNDIEEIIKEMRQSIGSLKNLTNEEKSAYLTEINKLETNMENARKKLDIELPKLTKYINNNFGKALGEDFDITNDRHRQIFAMINLTFDENTEVNFFDTKRNSIDFKTARERILNNIENLGGKSNDTTNNNNNTKETSKKKAKVESYDTATASSPVEGYQKEDTGIDTSKDKGTYNKQTKKAPKVENVEKTELEMEAEDVAMLVNMLGIESNGTDTGSTEDALNTQKVVLRLLFNNSEFIKKYELDRIQKTLNWIQTTGKDFSPERKERATYKTIGKTPAEIAKNKAKYEKRSEGKPNRYLAIQLVEEIGEFIEESLSENGKSSENISTLIEIQKRVQKVIRFGATTVIKDAKSPYNGQTNLDALIDTLKENKGLNEQYEGHSFESLITLSLKINNAISNELKEDTKTETTTEQTVNPTQKAISEFDSIINYIDSKATLADEDINTFIEKTKIVLSMVKDNKEISEKLKVVIKNTEISIENKINKLNEFKSEYNILQVKNKLNKKNKDTYFKDLKNENILGSMKQRIEEIQKLIKDISKLIVNLGKSAYKQIKDIEKQKVFLREISAIREMSDSGSIFNALTELESMLSDIDKLEKHFSKTANLKDVTIEFFDETLKSSAQEYPKIAKVYTEVNKRLNQFKKNKKDVYKETQTKKQTKKKTKKEPVSEPDVEEVTTSLPERIAETVKNKFKNLTNVFKSDKKNPDLISFNEDYISPFAQKANLFTNIANGDLSPEEQIKVQEELIALLPAGIKEILVGTKEDQDELVDNMKYMIQLMTTMTIPQERIHKKGFSFKLENGVITETRKTNYKAPNYLSLLGKIKYADGVTKLELDENFDEIIKFYSILALENIEKTKQNLLAMDEREMSRKLSIPYEDVIQVKVIIENGFIPISSIINDVASDAYEQLSIRINPNVDKSIKEGIIASIGSTIKGTLLQGNLNGEPYIETLADETVEINNKFYDFVRVNTNAINNTLQNEEGFDKVKKSINKMRYISPKQKRTFIQKEAFTKDDIQRNMIRTNATISNKNYKFVVDQSAIPWYFKSEMIEFSKVPRDEALLMQGYVDLTDPKIRESYHSDEMERIISINDKIAREYDFLINVFNSEDFDIDTEFFIPWGQNKSGRPTIISDMNPQESKMIRSLIEQKGHVKLWGKFDVKKNLTHYELALAQALDLDPDKLSKESSLKAIRDVVNININPYENEEFFTYNEDSKLSMIIRDIIEGDLSGSDLAKKYNELFYAGEGAHGVQGVNSLIKLKKWLESGREGQFRNDLTLETDAITSGMMLTLMQILTENSIELLAKGGIFTKETQARWKEYTERMLEHKGLTVDEKTFSPGALIEAGNYHAELLEYFEENPDELTVTNNGITFSRDEVYQEEVFNDLYKTVGAAMESSVTEIKKELQEYMDSIGSIADLNEFQQKVYFENAAALKLLDSIGKLTPKKLRKIAKDPVMVYVYGATLNSIKQKLAHSLGKETFISNIKDLLKDINNKDLTEEQKEVIESKVGYIYYTLVSYDIDGGNKVQLKKYDENNKFESNYVFTADLINELGNLDTRESALKKLMTLDFNDKMIQNIKKMTDKTFSDAIEQAFDKEFGEIDNYRDRLKSIELITFELFKKELDEEIEKSTEANNGALTTVEFNRILKDLEKKGFGHILPTMVKDKNGEYKVQNFLSLLKSEKNSSTKQASAVYDFNEAPANALEANEQKRKYTYLDTGNSVANTGFVATGSIHEIDGRLIVESIKNNDWLSIYDAIVQASSIENISESAGDYNYSTLDVSLNRNITEDNLRKLSNMATIFTETLKNNPERLDSIMERMSQVKEVEVKKTTLHGNFDIVLHNNVFNYSKQKVQKVEKIDKETSGYIITKVQYFTKTGPKGYKLVKTQDAIFNKETNELKIKETFRSKTKTGEANRYYENNVDITDFTTIANALKANALTVGDHRLNLYNVNNTKEGNAYGPRLLPIFNNDERSLKENDSFIEFIPSQTGLDVKQDMKRLALGLSKILELFDDTDKLREARLKGKQQEFFSLHSFWHDLNFAKHKGFDKKEKLDNIDKSGLEKIILDIIDSNNELEAKYMRQEMETLFDMTKNGFVTKDLHKMLNGHQIIYDNGNKGELHYIGQSKTNKDSNKEHMSSKNKSTLNYKILYDKINKANAGSYSKHDVVYVSVNGKSPKDKDDRNRFVPFEFKNQGDSKIVVPRGAYKNIDKAIEAGSTIITDKKQDRDRDYNIGEREIAAYLEYNGYVEKDGVWTPSDNLTPEQIRILKGCNK